MGNFAQATEHYVHMYVKFGGLTFYEFLQLDTSSFDLSKFSTLQ
jgi:hypothetical protein